MRTYLIYAMDFSVFKVATVTTVETAPLAVSPAATSPGEIFSTNTTTSGEILIVMDNVAAVLALAVATRQHK